MKKVLIAITVFMAIMFNSCGEIWIDPDKEPQSNETSKPSKLVAVDFGLPSGLKWATCNLGATSPEQYGDYFAWGEIEPYYCSQSPLAWKDNKMAGYKWTSYKWCNGSYSTLTKYNYRSYYGTIDNKTVLDPEDDVAHVKLGGKWRIPTKEEWQELIYYCTATVTIQNGMQGMLVTSNINGNSIFLPSTGNYWGESRQGPGSTGYYWSSSLHLDNPYDAHFLYYTIDSRLQTRNCNRCYGFSVRPVCD